MSEQTLSDIAVLKDKVDTINKKLESVESKLETRLSDFSEINQKLFRFEHSISSIKEKLDEFDGKINKVESKIDDHQLSEIQSSSENLKRLDNIIEKIGKLPTDKKDNGIKDILENKAFVAIIGVLLMVIAALVGIDITDILKLLLPS